MPAKRSPSPLNKVLRKAGLTQEQTAKYLRMRQPALSRIGRGVCSRARAMRVLDRLDPARAVLTELHLLYPERYESWEPPRLASGGLPLRKL